MTEYGAPEAIVSDGGSIFKTKCAMAIDAALGIQKEQIQRRQAWQSYIETNFNVQRRMADYYFATPVRLARGDQLYVECHWDNTAANQKIVNGTQQEPRTIHWGTDQEMCGAVVTFSEAVSP